MGAQSKNVKSGNNITAEEEISPLTQRYQKLVFKDFTADSQIATDYPTALLECENSTMAAVISKKLFDTVEKFKDGVKYSGALLVTGRVVNLKIVSLGSRVFRGASGGASDMSVLLTFKNGTDGAVVKETLLSSASNSIEAAITYGRSDRSLPEDMGRIIAEYIASITPAK